MQRDCSDGCRGSVIKTHLRSRRNLRQQEPWNAGEFGVYGVASTGAGDTIAGLNVCDAFSHGHHSSGAAVPGSTWLIHAIANRGEGRDDAVSSYLVPHLAHQVRTHFRLLHQVLAGKFR